MEVPLKVPLELSEIGCADQKFYQPLFLVHISIPGFPCHNLMNSTFSTNSLIFSGPNKFTASLLSCHLDFLFPVAIGELFFFLRFNLLSVVWILCLLVFQVLSSVFFLTWAHNLTFFFQFFSFSTQMSSPILDRPFNLRPCLGLLSFLFSFRKSLSLFPMSTFLVCLNSGGYNHVPSFPPTVISLLESPVT